MAARPTLEDVARAAGVSTATVSRVLNAPAQVRADTRRRIEEAIARLGYTPHFGGRALALGRTGTIGAVIPTMENAIFARGLQTLQETFAEAGMTLLIATSGYDLAREAGQISVLLSRGVDGLVLIGEARADETYETLRRRRVPFVLMWTWRKDSPYVSIGFDNRAAARTMAQEVLDAGHRRIAMISGVTHGNDRAAQRVDGVRAAMEAHGLRLGPDALVETAYDLDAGAAAAERLLRGHGPTAIICGNDVLAAGAVAGANACGLAVPEDVSVVGFDDIDLARVVRPALTTVHVPHRRMGHQAASALLSMIAGHASEESLPLETHMVTRGSLAPPPR